MSGLPITSIQFSDGTRNSVVLTDDTHAVIQVNNLPFNQPFDFVVHTSVPLTYASIHSPVPFVGPVPYSYSANQTNFIYFFTIGNTPTTTVYVLLQWTGANGNLTFQVNVSNPQLINMGDSYDGSVSLNQIQYFYTNYVNWKSPGYFAVELSSACAHVFITANGNFPDLLNGEGQVTSVNSTFQLLLPITNQVNFRIGVLGTQSCDYSFQAYFGNAS